MKPPPTIAISHFIGFDIGKRSDPSKLCVLERIDDPARELAAYKVRDLVRWHLGTPYPRVKADVIRMVGHKGLVYPLLVADQTGVGEAIVDMALALCMACWAAERSCSAMPGDIPDAARSMISKAPEGVFLS